MERSGSFAEPMQSNNRPDRNIRMRDAAGVLGTLATGVLTALVIELVKGDTTLMVLLAVGISVAGVAFWVLRLSRVRVRFALAGAVALCVAATLTWLALPEDEAGKEPLRSLPPRFPAAPQADLNASMASRNARREQQFSDTTRAAPGDLVEFSLIIGARTAEGRGRAVKPLRAVVNIPADPTPNPVVRLRALADNAIPGNDAVTIGSPTGKNLVLGRPFDFRLLRREKGDYGWGGLRQVGPGHLQIAAGPHSRTVIVSPVERGRLSSRRGGDMRILFKAQVFADTQNRKPALEVDADMRRYGTPTWHRDLVATDNDTLHFRIFVRNGGDGPAENVFVTADILYGITLIPGTVRAPTAHDADAVVVEGGVNIGEIPAGESSRVSFDAKVHDLPDSPQTLKLPVSARADNDDEERQVLTVRIAPAD
jgi:uncharacterized repeat protein (TIGR01451 family)